MLRDMKASDRGVVAGWARKLAAEKYPFLRPDVEKINAVLQEAQLSNRHYARVRVDAQDVAGAVLIGATSEIFWAQRKHCAVVLWYSQLPGAGAELLRDFRQWVLDQRPIRAAGLQIDCEVDPRALKLADRIGFKQRGGAYLLYTREVAHGFPV